MSEDGLTHISKKTRERAYILSRNAKQLGIPLGAARFTPTYDYMSFYLSNEDSWAVIFCYPEGYLATINSFDSKAGSIQTTPLAVRNIRTLLQNLKKRSYVDVDVMLNELKSKFDNDEVDLRSYLDALEDPETN